MKYVVGDLTTVSSRNEISNEQRQRKDEADIARFGKRQQLKRNFGRLSIISLTCTVMITWEGTLVVLGGGLLNGGPAGVIYGFIFVWIGSLLQILVMAEMASMMPLAGGQYNWVSILAPDWCSKFLSYITGWTTVMAWQAAIAGACYLAGAMVEALVQLSMGGTYVAQRWHGTLLCYAILAISLFINTFLARMLPFIESLVFIVHVVGFFCVLIPLLYFGPHVDASSVFLEFTNGGYWPSDGLSFFIGLSLNMFTFFGLDAAGHMAEEIKNASNVIPTSMIASTVINGALGLAMIIGILFCLDNQEEALSSSTGFPFIETLFNATESIPGTAGMVSIIIIAMTFSAVGILATGSRMMWAFARERGLPGYSFISKIEPQSMLPLYSLSISTIISIGLALINIASSTAFSALVSLSIAGFYSSYTVAAAVLLHKRLTTPRAKIRYGPFSLGRAGIPVIVVSLLYSVLGAFFSFWPPTMNSNPSSMNWSVVVFIATLTLSLGFWAVRGRHVYTGPIMELDMR